MKLNIYAVYDRVTGLYSDPWLAVNEAAAIRRFKASCFEVKVVAADLQLFYLGTFEQSTGVIDAANEFIVGGEIDG